MRGLREIEESLEKRLRPSRSLLDKTESIKKLNKTDIMPKSSLEKMTMKYQKPNNNQNK